MGESKTYRTKHPWAKAYDSARQRCCDKNHNRYKNYGGRGIKFLMTKEDFKLLWFRDKAYNMDRPSIDRVKVDKDYTIDNCHYIELSDNIKKDSGMRIASYKDGKLIKEFNSQAEASRFYGISQGNIWNVLNKPNRTAGGFIWKNAKNVK